MRKIRAAINMTLDGFCNHDAVTPDAKIHQHYTELLRTADAILYGRITFELMKYWQNIILNPTGTLELDEFAQVIDGLPKIAFSKTLTEVAWHSARLASRTLEEEVKLIRQQPGRDILVGSRSLIMQLIDLRLLDELELMVHPVIAGKGTAALRTAQPAHRTATDRYAENRRGRSDFALWFYAAHRNPVECSRARTMFYA